MHALCVDKSAISQRMLANFLRGVANLTVVADIAEAKLNLLRTPFDAMLLVEDERIDELLRYVHDLRLEGSPLRERPIILLAADASDDLSYRAWRAGVTLTLAKTRLRELPELLALQTAHHVIQMAHRDGATVEFLEWTAGGLSYCYSPDLNRLVTDTTREAARQGMRRLCQQFAWCFTDSRHGEARCKIARERMSFTAWEENERVTLAPDASGSRLGLPSLPMEGQA